MKLDTPTIASHQRSTFQRRSSEHGAAMVEYVIAAAMLAAIFVVIGVLLYSAAVERGVAAGRTAETMGGCAIGVYKTDPSCL